MSIASKLYELDAAKNDIFDAIETKGVTVPAGSGLADAPALIGSISGGGGGSVGISEKNFVAWASSSNKTHIIITNEFIRGVPFGGSGYSDTWRWAVEPLYDNKVSWDDLNVDDEIEINAIVNCPRMGSGRTCFFGPSNNFGSISNVDSYKFEINNYDGTSWFYILGTVCGSQFSFDFNTDVTINLLMKKIDTDNFNFVCKYNGQTKYIGTLNASSGTRADMILPMFGNPSASNSMMCGCKLILGSYIKYKGNILFGKQL